jgi:hypothetical protein
MGIGVDLARPENPEHAKVIDDFKEQLLIVMVKRLGGKAEIPIEEVDDTGKDLLMMSVENGAFHFEVVKKQ